MRSTPSERRAAARQARRIRRRRGAAALALAATALLFYLLLVRSSDKPAPFSATRSPGSLNQGARRRTTGPNTAQDPAGTARILAYTSFIAAGSGHARDVALTFDDGPSAYTPTILKILRREHAQATFFEVGREVRARPQVARAVVAAGMPVGNHTQTHASLGHLAPGAQGQEIDGLSNALKAAGLPATTLFRPPYGSFNPATLAELHRRRMLMVLWSADTKDFSQPGVKRIVYVAVSGAKPGAIILMHDGGGNRAQTVAALPRIIQRLHQRGFRLVTLPQLLRDDPPPHRQRVPHSLAGN